MAALEAIELDVLGKKGRLTGVLRGIGALPAEDRPKVGAIANPVRAAIEAAIARRGRPSCGPRRSTARLAAEAVDVTTPGRPDPRAARSTRASRRCARSPGSSASSGSSSYESPEVEDDLTNFQMLNIPPDHPARDLWDTLYVDVPGHLLRTHTSPGQIRVMRTTEPPIRALLPGRCFRYEAIDASHGSEFFQVEGLMVDEGTTMGDLRGPARRVRPRDVRRRQEDPLPARLLPVHRAVGGLRRRVPRLRRRRAARPAAGRGWMTILGAGMVHPVVLRYGGLDPERYQGFAFGMGPERISMLRHGINDLRLFLENDLRFLDQFR